VPTKMKPSSSRQQSTTVPYWWSSSRTHLKTPLSLGQPWVKRPQDLQYAFEAKPSWSAVDSLHLHWNHDRVQCIRRGKHVQATCLPNQQTAPKSINPDQSSPVRRAD
jgi:hypothetical protein